MSKRSDQIGDEAVKLLEEYFQDKAEDDEEKSITYISRRQPPAEVELQYRENLADDQYNERFSQKEKREYKLHCIQDFEQRSKTSIIAKVVSFFKVCKNFANQDIKTALFVVMIIVAIPVIILLKNYDEYKTFKEIAYMFAKSISSSCLDVSILMIVCFVYNVFKRHKTSRVLYVSLILSLVVGSFHIPFVLGIGTTQIGDYYELTEYTEYYYVQMSRNPETDANRKVYTLPAEICRSEDFEGYTEIKEDFYGNTYGGRETYKTNYHINYLYFNNGGYLCFSDNDPERNAVVLNKEIKIQDYHDETFYITLTANKADVSSIAIRATANKGSE